MQTTPDESAAGVPVSLSQSLRALLQRNSAPQLTVGDIIVAVEGRGFGLLLMVLALPSALPVPAPGYSVPFGMLIALLGMQMLTGRSTPWLPQRVHAWKVKRSMATKMTAGVEGVFGRLERWVKPRMPQVTTGRAGRLLPGGLVVFMALLMCIPIPLTNTAPAMVIFLMGVGISEKDGLFTLVTCALGVVAALFYGMVLAVAFHLLLRYGPEGLTQLKDTLTAWFRG